MLNAMEQHWVEGVMEKLEAKMEWVSDKSRDKIPYTTIEGIHDDRSLTDMDWWTNGFWGGMMWLMHHVTGNNKYKEIAHVSEEKLDECFRKFYGLHHDVGFMWLPTSVAHYRVTNHPESRKRALHAANLLAGRFNLAGGFIRAWKILTEKTAGAGLSSIVCSISHCFIGPPRNRATLASPKSL